MITRPHPLILSNKHGVVYTVGCWAWRPGEPGTLAGIGTVAGRIADSYQFKFLHRVYFCWARRRHLHPLRGQHKRRNAAHIPRHPGNSPQEARSLRLNQDIRRPVRNPRQRIPQPDPVDDLVWDAGLYGKDHYTISIAGPATLHRLG